MKTSKIVLKILSGTITLLVIMLLVFGVFTLGTVAYDFGYRIFTEESMDVVDGKEVAVQVTAKMSGKELGEILEDKGLIRSVSLFQVQYRVSDYYNKIKTGLYVLNTTMTPEEIIEILATPVEQKNDN